MSLRRLAQRGGPTVEVLPRGPHVELRGTLDVMATAEGYAGRRMVPTCCSGVSGVGTPTRAHFGIDIAVEGDDRKIGIAPAMSSASVDRGTAAIIKAEQRRLRDLLVANYDFLFKRLSIRLKSRDSAIEVLHETYLRLDRFNDLVTVQSPKDYIFRAAINIAKNRHKAESYRATASKVEAMLDVPDEAPDPARIVEARSEIEALKRALAELPTRRREVLNAISIEGVSSREVAARLQVSVRTVETDLKHALQHCAKRLGYKLTRRAGGPRPGC